jgi:hypothetical protein
MQIKKHICSLEHAKRLKELGVEQKSYFMWEGIMSDVDEMRFKVKKLKKNGNPDAYSAFTVAELGEMMKKVKSEYAPTIGYIPDQWVTEWNKDIDATVFLSDTEADARAKALIHLLEHNLITLCKTS